MQYSGNVVDIRGKRIYQGTVNVDTQTGAIASVCETGAEDPAADYILPGFIDAHIHIESTLLTPEHYAPLAAAHGVTGVVSDPHEIAYVLGTPGVDFMLDSAARVRFNFHFAAPPCVPSTTFENAGATLDSNAIEALLRRDEIYGLGEMMNVPGLVFGDGQVLAKIAAARAMGKTIDGHMAGAAEEWVVKCAEAGIATDHECVDIEEARMRLRHGISVIIREGSAACDYEKLSPLLGEAAYEKQLMFCSDDKYADELQAGYIDDLVRESIRRGYPLWTVLRAACINPVETYHLSDGTLREGDKADFIIVDNLSDFRIKQAFVAGRTAGEPTGVNDSGLLPNNFKAGKLSESDLAIAASSDKIKVIKVSDGQLVTEALVCDARIEDGKAISQPDRDILKLLVYNRYTAGAKPALAFVSGFGLKKGAIACSIGHDSHNITALGTSDRDIVTAVNALVDCGGGMAVVSPTQGLVVLPLPIAGLMSDRPGAETAGNYRRIKAAVSSTGCGLNAPLMTMAFIPLPVIPALKLTDIGLFDAVNFRFCDLFV